MAGIESVRADSTTIDDFEDGDISEYSGDTSNFSVQSSVTMSGTYALEANDAATDIYSTSGLPNYPAQGDEWEYYVRSTEGTGSGNDSRTRMLFGWQDDDNHYLTQINHHSDYLGLFKKSGGTYTELASDGDVTGDFVADTWYRVRVVWDDGSLGGAAGDITIEVYDVGASSPKATITANDTAYASGGTGWHVDNRNGAVAWFDDARLTTPGSESELVIDDFEDDDLSEYTFTLGSEGAAMQTSTAQIHDGTYALELGPTPLGSGTTWASSHPGDGLWTYPQSGDTISFWFSINGDDPNYCNVIVGNTPGNIDGYLVQIDVVDDQFNLYNYGGPGDKIIQLEGFTFTHGRWYRGEFDWHGTADGEVGLALYDSDGTTEIASGTATDDTAQGNGIGFYSDLEQATVYVDSVKVTKTTCIGDFEGVMDGWETTGTNQLSTIDDGSETAPITRGSHALECTVNSDPEPFILNGLRIQSADFSIPPCICADILPASIENTDSPVTLRFRYHHSDPGGVEESPEMFIDQRIGGRIAWDMSGLSTTKLENPERLEIAWYPEEHPPGSGFDHNGRVFVDNVKVTDDQNQVAHARCSQKYRELRINHGHRDDITVETQNGSVQSGEFVYSDGTRIPYQGEILADGTVELTVDGEPFQYRSDGA